MLQLRSHWVRRAIGWSLLAGCVAAGAAQAETGYPSRPIKLIVPWTPGVPADAAARILAERMSASMKQPVVVENKPGASGTIGYAEALRQPADGYTLYVLSSASLVSPLLYPSRKFEFTQELEAAGHIHWSYNALVVPVNSPLKSLGDIVAQAKRKPGHLTYASGGNGTPAHLAGAAFNQHAGIDTAHIPYVQFPQAITDLLGGRISYMFMTTVSAVPQVTGGKMRALAVTSAKRLPALKDVPTMTELGIPNFVFRSFETLTVKAGTPKPIVERLNRELNKALASPEVRQQFEDNGWDIEPMTPPQITKVLADESERWLQLGRELQVKVD